MQFIAYCDFNFFETITFYRLGRGMSIALKTDQKSDAVLLREINCNLNIKVINLILLREKIDII